MKYQFTQKAKDRKQELIKEFEAQVKASRKERKRLHKICVDEVPLFEQLLELDTELEPHKDLTQESWEVVYISHGWVKEDLIIKDPRLCFTINEYDFVNSKIIIVKRSAKAHKDSLKRHYGPRFLSKQKYSKFSWTSNHFNLKIPPITYDKFSSSYLKNISKIKESHKDFLEIDYENLINKDPILVSNLESFIGAKINKDIINT